MKNRWIKLSLAWVFGFALTMNAQAADFFEQTFGNFAEELADARGDGKLGVFVFFEMDDCPFCHRMKDTILKEADVIDYFHQHFKTLRLDIEGANRSEEHTSELQSQG